MSVIRQTKIIQLSAYTIVTGFTKTVPIASIGTRNEIQFIADY